MDQYQIDQGDVRASDGPPLPPHGLTHTAVLPLLLAWAATRLILVASGTVGLVFYPAGQLTFDDLRVYAQWMPDLLAGVIPSDDLWQYPPASGFFFVLGALGPDPKTTLMIAIVLTDLALTLVLARHDLRAGWYWVGAGMLIGPVLVSRFDIVPTLFAVLAVLSVARPVRVGIWTAIGTMMKVWPLLLLVLVPPRRLASGLLGFLTTFAVLVGGCLLVFDNVGGFFGGQSRRGLQVESVGATPFLVARAIGGDVEFDYRYGSMEVISTGAGVAAAIATGIALLLFAWVAWCWFRGWFAGLPASDVAFTVVIFSVVISRVFSPQYSVWMLGIGVLCLVDPRSQVRLPVVLVAAVAVIAQVLYPWGYGRLLDGDQLMVLLQVVRICLVVAAGVIAGARVCRPVSVPLPAKPIRPPVPS